LADEKDATRVEKSARNWVELMVANLVVQTAVSKVVPKV
jgi:hypothetical protein